MNSTNPDWSLGSRYRVLRTLARGAFGQTYLAIDEQLPGTPQCIVKQLYPLDTTPETLQAARRLFDQEAEVLYRLGQGARVPQLFAHFKQEFCLVQQYIPGRTLRDELAAQAPLAEQKVIALLADVLETLQFIHAQGVIHRDIKPSNIIREELSGKLYLIDFGAVKQVATQTSMTQAAAGTMIGTMGYMPAEQALGNPQFSSDLYALGVVAIEALTGTSATELGRTPDGELQWDAPIRRPLKKLIDSMVRSDYRFRPASASQVRAELQALESSQDRPQPSRVQSPFVNKPAGIVAAVGLVVLGGGILISAPNLLNWLTSTQMINFEDAATRLHLQYPQDWIRQDIKDPLLTGTIVRFLPGNRQLTGPCEPVLTLNVENLRAKTSLLTYSQMTAVDLMNSYPGAKLVERQNTRLGGLVATRMLFQPLREGACTLTLLQTTAVDNLRAIYAVYRAPEPAYERYLPTIEKMLSTVELIPQ